MFRRAVRDYRSAVFSAFGTEVDNMVRHFYYVEIMFDYYNGIAFGYESLQNSDKFFDVLTVQSGSRFVKNINRFAGRSF